MKEGWWKGDSEVKEGWWEGGTVKEGWWKGDSEGGFVGSGEE